MIKLYQEGNGFYGIDWNEELGSYTTHVILPEADEWSLSSFRKYKKVFEDARKQMKEMGIKSVLGLCETKKESLICCLDINQYQMVLYLMKMEF